ncbi:hypothetical protein SAMN05443637_10647 [Pseudonocardia thermophila]|uniref:Uncharacterized protein n=1 Tax=Pseudonocardia thermophila TaxID=1848 RepID=A0A1M6SBF4_PSETH|nr:hypothetical protein [Pseudonocardia thermophila]SHK42046.1 hypothetical protein SAMN05443637_10647 [Pseudonocardia thermophila]
MQWLYTGLLIVAGAGTAAYTGFLLRRLFTLEPAVPPAGEEPQA